MNLNLHGILTLRCREKYQAEKNDNTHHCQFHVSASEEDEYQIESNCLTTDLHTSVITKYVLHIAEY